MKKLFFGLTAWLAAFILGFHVFAQDGEPLAEKNNNNSIEQIAKKIEQAVEACNSTTIDKQKKAIDMLFDAAQTHKNSHVQAAARSTLEGVAVKYESQNFTGTRFIDIPLLAIFPGSSSKDISYSVDDPQKPVSGNISDIYISDEIEKAQSMGGQLGFDGYHDMLMLTYASNENNLEITGKVRNDIASMEVIRDGDQKVKEIKDFEPGQQDFSFKVSPKNKNIRLGGNRYLIRAYSKDATYHSVVTLVHLNERSSSLAGETIVKKATTSDQRREQANSCYSDFETEEEQQTCLGQITQDFTIDEKKACAMDDGRLNYFFQIQRPNKAAVIEHLYKKGSRLYYPVKLGNQYPGCEDTGYEILLYYYDCDSGERVKVLGNNSDEERLSKCDMQLQYASNEDVLARKSAYERHFGIYEGYELIGVTKKGVEKLTLFDAVEFIGTGGETKEIKGFDGNQELLEKVSEIVSIYNIGDVVFDGINYEIRDVQDDLTATLRVFVYGRSETSIVYDAKVDLLNKNISIGD